MKNSLEFIKILYLLDKNKKYNKFVKNKVGPFKTKKIFYFTGKSNKNLAQFLKTDIFQNLEANSSITNL